LLICRGCFYFVLPSTRRSKNECVDVISGPSRRRAKKSEEHWKRRNPA
jgi:hypothetical protein